MLYFSMPNKRTFYDFVIVGSGPAGLTLALELSKNPNLSILVLEAGSTEVNPETQRFLDGENVNSTLREDLKGSRARCFGGTSAFWGGETAPLDEDDFLPKQWCEISGWPIQLGDVEPYYIEAAKILDISNYRRKIPHSSYDYQFEDKEIEQKLWKIAKNPVRMGKKYFEWARTQPNVHVCLNSTVKSAVFKGRKVEMLKVKTQGQDWSVHGRTFILAAGGIENPRCLLNWKEEDKDAPFSIKNVGHYFSVHPYIGFPSGLFLYGEQAASPPNRFRSASHKINSPEEENEKYFFQVSSELRRKKQWDNFLIMPLESQLDLQVSNLSKSIREYFQSFSPATLFTQVNLLGESRLLYESTVGLSSKKDAHGRSLPKVDYRVSEKSVTNWVEGLKFFIKALGISDVGRMKYDFKNFFFESLTRNGFWGAHHHMCTTRMSSDETHGVVDQNLKVFGTDNLFVAGASVFGTAAAPNPTLTIVALSLRLAKHLSSI